MTISKKATSTLEFPIVIRLLASNAISWKELAVRIEGAVNETVGAQFVSIRGAGSPDRYSLRDPDDTPLDFK